MIENRLNFPLKEDVERASCITTPVDDVITEPNVNDIEVITELTKEEREARINGILNNGNVNTDTNLQAKVDTAAVAMAKYEQMVKDATRKKQLDELKKEQRRKQLREKNRKKEKAKKAARKKNRR